MNTQISQTIYEMVSEYSSNFSVPFEDNDREALAGYFNALVIRLIAEDEIDADVMFILANEFNVDADLLPGIAQYLSQWGIEDE
ncbi:DUF2543 family protein [Dickeya dadantii]|uniref:DUF2543 family protein n=1 Tax=Dickeya dadantii TaxID=204038 RepID=UPI001495E4DF|nr:DUF2543 family protein [Dickeya dadantii]NPE55892.1 DUF2543 family protein [Dickeya dadantii]NPE67116.1 DUF2543 family protein [Dickeya dadantii]